jgi:hypothetical protein
MSRDAILSCTDGRDYFKERFIGVAGGKGRTSATNSVCVTYEAVVQISGRGRWY